MHVCMFSGHRALPHDPQIAFRLREHVERLYDRGVRQFMSGGALGFDLLAAETVLALRERCPQIELCMVLPCANQADKFPDAQRARYDRLIEQADKVVTLSEQYYDGCMLARNLHMAQCADVCLCYLRYSRGGTYHAVGAAAARGLPVINLAETEDK